MIKKFEIDQEIIDKETHCQHSFACLGGNFSHCGNVQAVGDVLHCRLTANDSFLASLCIFKQGRTPDHDVCCLVRKEIFRKYQV